MNTDTQANNRHLAEREEYDTRAASAIVALRDEVETLEGQRDELLNAASALIEDVNARYPNEELRCEYMRNLAAAIANAKGQS